MNFSTPIFFCSKLLALLIFSFDFWQAPAVMSRQIPQNHDDSCTDEHGRQRTYPIPADRAYNRADQRSGGVEVFHKHVGSIAREYVPQDSTANTGEYTYENRKVGVGVRNMDIGCLDTDDGKERKPDSVHNAKQNIVKGISVLIPALKGIKRPAVESHTAGWLL